MNGSSSWGDGQPGRRVRIDRLDEGGTLPLSTPGVAAVSAKEERTTSGRVLVTSAVLVVLVLWGSLYLAFRQWRSRYQERAAFGARYVAAAIDPLAEVVPAGEIPAGIRVAACTGASTLITAMLPSDVSPDTWRQAVDETHTMLVTVTAANILDLSQMRALRCQIASRVAGARPETSRATLAALWDDLEDQAGPIVLSRHARPALLPPSIHRAAGPLTLHRAADYIRSGE
jgi:hypothetical protein